MAGRQEQLTPPHRLFIAIVWGADSFDAMWQITDFFLKMGEIFWQPRKCAIFHNFLWVFSIHSFIHPFIELNMDSQSVPRVILAYIQKCTLATHMHCRAEYSECQNKGNIWKNTNTYRHTFRANTLLHHSHEDLHKLVCALSYCQCNNRE